MLTHALVGLSLIVAVAVDPGVLAPDSASNAAQQMTFQEKRAVLQPLVKSATDCVARAVAADPRLGKTQFTDLIVDSFRSCTPAVRALIDAHDRYYGAGTGEQFFMGPYLDALPAVVTGIVYGSSQ
jgi:hypothetical protein